MDLSEIALEIAVNTFTTGIPGGLITCNELMGLSDSMFAKHVNAAQRYEDFSTQVLREEIITLALAISDAYN
jgi:ABC-type transporter Mla maintaining outer membrane lipid asymmetry permease subunit MlaE